MSARERREHLERAIAEGGVIMTAGGQLTRQVPSSSRLARTPDEKRLAMEDLERRGRELEHEYNLLNAGDDYEGLGMFERAEERMSKERSFREPEGDKGTGELPEKFPARQQLVDAGYTTQEAVNALSEDELKGLGIPPAAVGKIMRMRGAQG